MDMANAKPGRMAKVARVTMALLDRTVSTVSDIFPIFLILISDEMLMNNEQLKFMICIQFQFQFK